MTAPKRPKRIPRCALCLDADREDGLIYCRPCGDHQKRAAAVARRVNAGRRGDATETERRGQGVAKPKRWQS